jgi:hypothetical protein
MSYTLPLDIGQQSFGTCITIKVFFLDLVFLPEGTGITGYREILEIPPIYRTEFFNQILNSIFFTPKQIEFVSPLIIPQCDWYVRASRRFANKPLLNRENTPQCKTLPLNPIHSPIHNPLPLERCWRKVPCRTHLPGSPLERQRARALVVAM